MNPTSAADQNCVSPVALQQYLLAELVAFCGDDMLILDVCRELAKEDPHQGVAVSKRVAAEIVLEGKVRVLERLLIDGRVPEFSDYLTKHFKYIIAARGLRELLRVVCLCLTHLSPPCEFLIVDKFVRGLDRPLVANHWIERSRCLRHLADNVSQVIA